MKESTYSPHPPAIAAVQSGDTAELLQRYTVPNYGRLPLAAARGSGARLYDESGRAYLDFGGGVAVCSLGHCPPEITTALIAQSQTLIHCSNWYQIRGQGELARFIVQTVMEAPGKCLFCNSGAEANEGLIKLARKFGNTVLTADGRQRKGIITFHQSFHGRTFAGISATGQDKVKQGFTPLLEGFTHLPYNDIDALEAAVSEDTIAILLEPVQGEGGATPATAEFLRACARICQERNALLLFDEVQCGLGRTGAWKGWAPIAPEIIPDAVSWAKGIAGGFPLGALWISHRPLSATASLPLCDLLGPGSHGTTYGGNPLGCAVALAVLHAIDEQKLCARSAQLGAAMAQSIQSWQHPLLMGTRGLGLLLGVVINTSALASTGAWQPADGFASMFLVKKLMAAGLLAIAAGPDVIRLLPPLNVKDTEVAEALQLLRQSLDLLLT